MRNFQDTFETRKRSFISAFSIYITVPLKYSGRCASLGKRNLYLPTNLKAGNLNKASFFRQFQNHFYMT